MYKSKERHTAIHNNSQGSTMTRNVPKNPQKSTMIQKKVHSDTQRPTKIQIKSKTTYNDPKR